MNYEGLSERQKAMLKFIQEFSDEHGYPPTIREIGNAVNINSTSVVNYNLTKLVKQGFIQHSKKVSRGLRINPQFIDTPINVVDRRSNHRGVVDISIYGNIVAGTPVPVPDDTTVYPDDDAHLPVPQQLLGKVNHADVYALTVNGHSMIDSMIDDGDIVVLKRQAVAKNGDMVAVWLTDRGETTLKHFYDEGTRIRLQPANPTMEAIYVDKDKVIIQGRVLAVLRKVH